MSRTYKDRVKWHSTIRWADKKIDERMWFFCHFCKMKFSGRYERAVNNEIVCPLCGDAHTDRERIY